jgi:hypothetical protein
MFEADERHSASVDDQLTGVRSTDPTINTDVDVAIHLEQFPALLLGASGEGDDVGASSIASKSARPCITVDRAMSVKCGLSGSMT